VTNYRLARNYFSSILNCSTMNASVSKVAARTLSWIIAVILVLLPFHAFFTTWIGSNTGHIDVVRIWKEIIILLIVPLALWLAWHQPKVRTWLMSSWIVRLFALYSLLYIALGLLAWHQHLVNKEALAYSLIIALRFIGFFIICYIAAASSSLLKNNWRMILFLPAATVVFFGILQRLLLPYDFLKHFGYGPNTIPTYQTIDNNLAYRRIQSALRGANPLGAYLVLIIPAIIFGIKSQIFKCIALVATFIVLFFSFSRSAWIGVFLAILALAWLSKFYVGRLKWILPIAAIAVILGAGVFLNIKSNQTAQGALFHTTKNSKSPLSTNSVRSNSLKSGVRDVVDYPLGGGPGTAGPASFRNGQSPKLAENYYLQIGQEVGVTGMILFIGINILVGLELWKRKNEVLPQILLASLIGITFVNMLSHAWADDTLCYLWWGFAGIALAPVLKKKL
jgi:O-antigen ligase